MIKYVFMNYWEGYQKCILNALQNEDNIYTFKPINNNIERKLISWHNSWRLNRKIELPFKILWIKRCMKDIDVSQNDEIFFVLYESFHMTYSISFLKYLHKKYKKAKFVYMFSNPVDEYNKSKLTYISNYIDMVITFNEKDAEKNGYFYFPNQPYQVPVYECESRSDLFFIGADKGRLDKLLSVYEKVSREGYKCEFYIVGVPKEKQVEKEGIIYNKKLSYDEVLERVASTKCVLEILQGEQMYASIRTAEAMQYHKKLLTNSNAIKKHSLYNEKIVQIFDDVEEIDTSFFSEEPKDEDYIKNNNEEVLLLKEFLLKNS